VVKAVALVVALLIGAAGWLIGSQMHSASVAHDKQIGALQSHATDAQSLQASYQRHSVEIERIWDQSDDERRRALQFGDEHYAPANAKLDNTKRVADLLGREQIAAGLMETLATRAISDETIALNELGDRYGAGAVSSARHDLATTLMEIHNEGREWNRALSDMLHSPNLTLASSSYYINDTTSPKIKGEFAAAEQAASNANAARDAFQSDSDVIVAKLKADADAAAGALKTGK
jgi:hypothetical protein